MVAVTIPDTNILEDITGKILSMRVFEREVILILVLMFNLYWLSQT